MYILDRQTDRQKDRRTDRRTDIQTDRQTMQSLGALFCPGIELVGY